MQTIKISPLWLVLSSIVLVTHSSPTTRDMTAVDMDTAFKSSLNSFNFKFLNTINSQQRMKSGASNDGLENVFFSPSSISTALGMVLSGAKGSTKDELINALDLGTVSSAAEDGSNIFGHQFQKLITDYTSSQKNESSRILANKMVLNEGFLVNQVYEDEIKNSFKAEIKSHRLTSPSIVPLLSGLNKNNNRRSVTEPGTTPSLQGLQTMDVQWTPKNKFKGDEKDRLSSFPRVPSLLDSDHHLKEIINHDSRRADERGET